MAEPQYERLARPRSRSQFSVVYRARSGLWLGNDHLLQVETNGFTENYKRFYFRDIQTITQVETKRGRVWSIIQGSILLVVLLVMVFNLPGGTPAHWSDGAISGEVVLATVMVIAGVFLSAGILAGPTCKVYLRTAVQIEELAALCRMRQTRKVMNKIRPRIVAAQGELSGEEVSVRLQEEMHAQSLTQSLEESPPDARPPVIT
jgi:hypothetical protein